MSERRALERMRIPFPPEKPARHGAEFRLDRSNEGFPALKESFDHVRDYSLREMAKASS